MVVVKHFKTKETKKIPKTALPYFERLKQPDGTATWEIMEEADVKSNGVRSNDPKSRTKKTGTD